MTEQQYTHLHAAEAHGTIAALILMWGYTKAFSGASMGLTAHGQICRQMSLAQRQS